MCFKVYLSLPFHYFALMVVSCLSFILFVFFFLMRMVQYSQVTSIINVDYFELPDNKLISTVLSVFTFILQEINTPVFSIEYLWRITCNLKYTYIA